MFQLGSRPINSATVTAGLCLASCAAVYTGFRIWKRYRSKQLSDAKSKHSKMTPLNTQEKQILNEIFEDAVKFVRYPPSAAGFKPTQNHQLHFYGLYKQATEGNCTDSCPSLLEFRSRAKWDAWNQHKDMDQSSAKELYVMFLDQLVPEWSSFEVDETQTVSENSKSNQDGEMAPTISMMKYAFGEDENTDEASKQHHALFQTVQEGNVNEVQQQLEHGIDSNTTNADGETLLHMAADAGQLEMVKLLLQYKADIDRREPEMGQTALHYAITNSNFDVAKMLIQAGADIQSVDNDGCTPIDFCTSEEMTTQLLQMKH